MFDEISIIWNTDELKRSKPSPFDEARWGLAIIEDSLWETIPKVYRRLNQIFVKNMKKGCLLYTSPSPRDRTRSRMPSSA